jgi:hypothetical protein
VPPPEAAQAVEPVEEVRFGGRRLRPGRLLDLASRVREAGIAVALALLVIVVAVIEPRFIKPNNLEEILLSVSILAIVAVGQTLVVLTRNIDLSVGSVNLQESYAKALLVDRPALAEAQAAGDVLGGHEVLLDAFRADVRPLCAKETAEKVLFARSRPWPVVDPGLA